MEPYLISYKPTALFWLAVFWALMPAVLHFLGDYFLQSDWMATLKKKRTWPCFVHCFVYTLPFVPFVLWARSDNPWVILAVIFGTHFLIDRTKLVSRIIHAKNHLAPGFRYPRWDLCDRTGYCDNAELLAELEPWAGKYLATRDANTDFISSAVEELWNIPSDAARQSALDSIAVDDPELRARIQDHFYEVVQAARAGRQIGKSETHTQLQAVVKQRLLDLAAMKEHNRPFFLTLGLNIVSDNALHIVINYAALAYL